MYFWCFVYLSDVVLLMSVGCLCVFFFKQKTAYEMRISDWSSDVCSSDLVSGGATAIDCSDTLLRTDSEGMELVGIGLNNIIAVAMNDAEIGRASCRERVCQYV